AHLSQSRRTRQTFRKVQVLQCLRAISGRLAWIWVPDSSESASPILYRHFQVSPSKRWCLILTATVWIREESSYLRSWFPLEPGCRSIPEAKPPDSRGPPHVGTARLFRFLEPK